MDALLRGTAAAFADTMSAGGIGIAARRITVGAACVGLATAFATAAVGCLVTALWIFVLPEVGRVGAPLIAAAALLLLCLALLVVARSILRQRPALPPATAVSGVALPALLIAEASRLIEENKGAALLAALLAGATAESLHRK
jgi:hypothetical protein